MIFMESDGIVLYSVYMFLLLKVITVLLILYGPVGSQWGEGERIARGVRKYGNKSMLPGMLFRTLSFPNERNMY